MKNKDYIPDTLSVINNHKSIRYYKNIPIESKIIDNIISATQKMPNSMNGQQVSIIRVNNKDKKAKLAVMAGEQAFINTAPVFLIFIMDFYKTYLACKKRQQQQLINENIEGIIVGAVDVGIAMGATIIAAESYGLGTVPIGGIRENLISVCKLLELPKYSIAIAGLCLGYPTHIPLSKPRLPLESFLHEEVYNNHTISEHINNYDETMEQYLKSIGRETGANWSNQVANFYNKLYPETCAALIKQGFKFK